MSNAYITGLLQSSFRGVPFFLRRSSVTDKGNKLVLHEYPDSTFRQVESLGQIPPKFTVEAFVSGKAWLQDSAALQAALDDPEIGRLILPVIGAFDVYALPYTIDDDQTALGEITFRLSFAAAQAEAIQPVPDATPSSVFDAGDEVRATLQTQVADRWTEPSVATNSAVAKYDLRSLADKISATMAPVLTTSQDIISKTEQIKRDIVYLTNNADQLAAALFALKEVPAGFFQLLANQLNHTATNIENILGLADWGSELTTSLQYIVTEPDTPLVDDIKPNGQIPEWEETSWIRVERNQNRCLLANAARIAVLTLAYEQAAAADYQTQREVVEIRKRLEQIYDNIVLDEYVGCSELQELTDIRRALDTMRRRALAVLALKEQQAYRIDTRELMERLDIVTVAYRLYADDIKYGTQLEDAVNLIRNLNIESPVLELHGFIDIFNRSSAA